MKRLTFIDGIGSADLLACKVCGEGCGDNNENCGNCESPLMAYESLAAYEAAGFTPNEITALRDISMSHAIELNYYKAQWTETAIDSTGYVLTHADGLYCVTGVGGRVICEFLRGDAKQATAGNPTVTLMDINPVTGELLSREGSESE